jgi:predicted CXXCH cytochrome family protein
VALISATAHIRTAAVWRLGLAALFLASPPLSRTALAVEPAGEDCLECHSDRELYLNLEDEDILSLYVDTGEWQSSPHAAVGCVACHSRVDIDSHPGEKAEPGSSWMPADWTKRCRDCHGRLEDYTASHQALLAQAKAPPCTECHSPHRMRHVRDWKPNLSVSVYCLTCHQKQIRISLDSGETLSLTIREAALGTSVHLDHQCTDCHEDYSRLEHPLKKIGSLQEAKAAGYGLCRNCHAEYYERFENSLHFKMARYGHPDAPLCTDCHGYHTVAPVKSFELLTGLPCRRCHDEVFRAFARGTHRARPRVAAHSELPACCNCHRAHESAFTPVGALMNDVCLQCHERAEEKHRVWLPNVATHFGSVACTACHAPAARRDFVVRIIDTDSGQPVPLDAFGGTERPDLLALLSNADEGRRDLAFWGAMASALGEQYGRSYHIRMELR